MIDDLRLELRFKNAKLFDLIEQRFRAERGERYGCCSLAASTIGIPIPTLNGYLTLRLSPWAKIPKKAGAADDLRLTEYARKVSDFFFADPMEVFPPALYRLTIPRLAVRLMDSERYLSFAEARQQKLLPPLTYSMELDEDMQNEELAVAVRGALEQLTPREERVMKLRYGLEGQERTYEDIAESFALSPMRIRQIESGAMRKLRHPSRVHLLSGFMQEQGA